MAFKTLSGARRRIRELEDHLRRFQEAIQISTSALSKERNGRMEAEKTLAMVRSEKTFAVADNMKLHRDLTAMTEQRDLLQAQLEKTGAKLREAEVEWSALNREANLLNRFLTLAISGKKDGP